MKKSIKLVALIVFSILGIGATNTLPTYADIDCYDSKIPESVRAAAGCNVTETDATSLPNLIVGIINTVIAAAALVAVIFIIIGGINYITSSGDAGKIKKAKDAILYASIGLVICILAFAIVWFVINEML